MMNLFNRFIGFFTAMFYSLFTGYNPSSPKDRLYEKMMRHNQEAYQRSRSKLQKYADKFLLPLMKRNKKTGMLEHTKKSRKYENWIAERKMQLREKRGHKWFDVEGVNILALNMKNAIKRKEKLGVYA